MAGSIEDEICASRGICGDKRHKKGPISYPLGYLLCDLTGKKIELLKA